jgi:hypothetical protein
MEMTQTKNRRSASAPGTTMVAVLLAAEMAVVWPATLGAATMEVAR